MRPPLDPDRAEELKRRQNEQYASGADEDMGEVVAALKERDDGAVFAAAADADSDVDDDRSGSAAAAQGRSREVGSNRPAAEAEKVTSADALEGARRVPCIL